MNLLLALSPSVALVVYGQLMLKWRMGQLSEMNSVSTSQADRILAYLQDPLILSGYCAAFLGSVAWMLTVDRYPLNQAFPAYIGLTLCLVMAGSVMLLGEALNPVRVAAIAMIICGVALSAQN